MQEIERAYLQAQPQRFRQVADPKRRRGFAIAAAIFLIAALAIALSAPALWEHFSNLPEARNLRRPWLNGSGGALFGIVLIGAFCLFFGLFCTWFAVAKSTSWVDSQTGSRLHNGRVARFSDHSAFDRYAAQLRDGTLPEIPEISGQVGSGKMILQSMEDREAHRVHIWLETKDGRTAHAELDGAAWERLSRGRTA
ncbi:hypothetical protein [Microbacterium halophytorum]|uniref:hypothetical protein n=1 Tax=Microbacterium halophytorum TaxID=2067568 RepID=UPI000CFD7112|nr:hypothetical protein [Microbacterium halophytorum]